MDLISTPDIDLISTPEIEIVSLNQVILPMSEEAAYESGTIQNGYGRASGVFVTVQRGTTANIDIDIELTTVSEESLNQWQEKASSYFSAQEWESITQGSRTKGRKAGLLSAIFGAKFGGRTDYYRNSSKGYQTQSQSDREGLARSLYNLETSKFNLKGKLTAVGTSFIPVTVSAYIQATQFTFSDNSRLTVVNTENPIAADQNGSTNGANSQPTDLNLIPLG
ncbi:hypothetical protein [Moorena sp. SIO4A5]|nr:hypothetical protein [Moorena sp. SIO4A5]